MLALIGGIAAVYGTLLVGFANHIGVSIPAAGVVLSIHFVGGSIGVVVSWWALRRMSGRLFLGAALAPTWDLLLGCVALVGIGFGCLDFGAYCLLAKTAQEGRATRITVAGSGYCIGCVVAPLIIAVIHPHHYQWFFAGVVIVALVLAALTRSVHAPPTPKALRSHLASNRRSDTRWTRRQPVATTPRKSTGDGQDARGDSSDQASQEGDG